MHHPTDRITHTTAFVTPVVEHWLSQTARQKTHCRHFIVYYTRFATSDVLYAPSHIQDSTYHVFVTLDVNHWCEWEVAQTGKIQCILLIMENMCQIYVYKCKCYCSICLCSLSKHVRLARKYHGRTHDFLRIPTSVVFNHHLLNNLHT